jgi:hypothetical protein
MRGTIRTALDGSGPFLWAALLFSFLGGLLLIAQLQSHDLVIWNGHCISATEEGGLVYFQANGQSFAINDVASPANSPTRTVTICYYPSHPEDAVVLHPAAYWFEGSLIGLPFLAAAVILIVGLVIQPLRMRRRRERLRL